MTDRELLESAAKAAGYSVAWNEHWECFQHTNPLPDECGHYKHSWVPLNDDGDALRLAVKLNLHVHACFGDGDHFASAGVDNPDYEPYEPYGDRVQWIGEGTDDDQFAATRRAIVRAAAELWKGKL